MSQIRICMTILHPDHSSVGRAKDCNRVSCYILVVYASVVILRSPVRSGLVGDVFLTHGATSSRRLVMPGSRMSCKVHQGARATAHQSCAAISAQQCAVRLAP